MSRVASEATDRPSLSHASEASNREQDVDELQDPLAMSRVASEATDRASLSHTRAKQATDLTASKTLTNRRTPLAMTEPPSHTRAKQAADLPRARRRRIAGPR